MKTLILDNYDSFTYNLYQYIAELGGNPVVYKNDEITLPEIKKLKPTHIIISPGPGNPTTKKDFGICSTVIKKLGKKIPILGVCLGHQGIIAVFGGKIVHAAKVMHGKKSTINWSRRGGPEATSNSKQSKASFNIFKSLPKTFQAMRYHSLIADKKSLPSCLVITAETTKDRLIMAVQHKLYPIYGVQFHPESFGTSIGKKLLRNFLSIL